MPSAVAVVPAEASVRLDRPESVPVALDYNVRLLVETVKQQRRVSASLKKQCRPRMIPARLVCDDVEFVMAPAAGPTVMLWRVVGNASHCPQVQLDAGVSVGLGG